jgi:multisubunit Na+/H+ antiporter MnhB subunit
MKNKYLLLAFAPLLILLKLYWITTMFDLISQPSDVAVLIGIVLLCLFLACNYVLNQYKLEFVLIF